MNLVFSFFTLFKGYVSHMSLYDFQEPVQIASASPYRYKKCFGTFFIFHTKKTRPNGLVSLYLEI